MRTIASIVEGDGEVKALPILLRRLAEERGIYDLTVSTPIRVPRDRFLRREEEFRRMLLLANNKAQHGAVLVLLDADDDCPVQLAQDVQRRGSVLVTTTSLHVVVANREYEAWLIAAAESLAGRRGLRDEIVHPSAPDSIRDAKGWLGERMLNSRYHEVSDQPALTALFDIGMAQDRSRSFRKFVDTLNSIFENL